MPITDVLQHGATALSGVFNATGLLLRGDPVARPEARPPGAGNAAPGAPTFYRGGMGVSSDMRQLLELTLHSPPSRRAPRVARTDFSPPPVSASAPVATSPATTASPDVARYQQMTPEQLLLEVALCAATHEDRGCEIDPRNNMPDYGRKFMQMVAALRQLPGRDEEVARLYNAEFALNAVFREMRHLTWQIRHIRPDLEPVLKSWAEDLANRSIREALLLPPRAHLLQRQDPATYAPVRQFVNQPIDTHVATMERMRTEAVLRQAPQAIEDVFRQIYMRGSRMVRGASADFSSHRDLFGVTHGNIVVTGSYETLLNVLPAIPAARIFPRPPGIFDSWAILGPPAPTTYFASYPWRSAVESVSWQDPNGLLTTVLVKADEVFGQMISLDLGRSWRTTGVPVGSELEAMRFDRWRRFANLRLKDEADPRWRAKARMSAPGWPLSS